MLKVLYYLPPSVTLKYSHPPHFISCLLIWFSVTSYKTTFPYQICTSLCVSLLITEADKLLHSQEMILQSALWQKCKSCQVGSILLWSVHRFLHYLHTANRVLSLCSDQKGVLFDMCVCVCVCVVGRCSKLKVQYNLLLDASNKSLLLHQKVHRWWSGMMTRDAEPNRLGNTSADPTA